MATPDWQTLSSTIGRTKVVRPTFEDCLSICRNLRPADSAEVLATTWSDDRKELAFHLSANTDELFWCFKGVHGQPIALLGAHHLWPGMWAPWAMATPDFPEVALTMTRFVRKVMMPRMREIGWNRAECRVHDQNKATQRWLERMGGFVESVNHRIGRNGEAFYTYVFYPEYCAASVGLGVSP